MKHNLPDIKALARRVFKQPTRTKRVIVNPRREWYIGLAVGAVLLVGVGVWSVYVYNQHRSTDLQGDGIAGNTTTFYQAATVEEALDYFAQRTSRFSSIVSTPVVVETPVESDESEDDEVQTETEDSQTATTTEAAADADLESDSDTITETSDTETINEPETQELVTEVAAVPDTVTGTEEVVQ